MTSYKRFPSLRWIIQEEKAIFSRTGEIIPRKRWFFLSSSLGPGAQLNPSPLKDLASAWEQLFEQSRRRSPLPPSKVRATPNNDIRNDPWHEARWSIARLVPTVTHAYPTTMRPSFQATIQARGQPSASPKRMHNADIRNEQRPPTRISLFVRGMMKRWNGSSSTAKVATTGSFDPDRFIPSMEIIALPNVYSMDSPIQFPHLKIF